MGKKEWFMRKGFGGEGVKGHSIEFLEMMTAVVFQTKHFCYLNICTIRKKPSGDFKNPWFKLQELTTGGCYVTKMERNSNGPFLMRKSACFYLFHPNRCTCSALQEHTCSCRYFENKFAIARTT